VVENVSVKRVVSSIMVFEKVEESELNVDPRDADVDDGVEVRTVPVVID
jgi:hypothetical protein